LDTVSLRISDRVVLFDYGEVISVSPNEADRAALLAVAGMPAEPFWESYWSHRDALDRGDLDVTEYWRTIGAEIGAAWSAGDIQRLWAADFRSWVTVEPGTVQLLEELHDGGTRVAVLSNAGLDFGSVLRFSPMGRFFERVFVSAEMGLLKPEPEIYLAAVAELGIAVDRLVFIDNKSVNTNAVAALGATVHHFTGVEGLRQFLASLAS
jgi:putative hydrolase of the HAD superfamily